MQSNTWPLEGTFPAMNARVWTLWAQWVQQNTEITAGIGKPGEEDPSQTVAIKEEGLSPVISRSYMEHDFHGTE